MLMTCSFFSSKNSKKRTLLQCSAPAKLILSGEHSVLYGAPALSIPVAIESHCQLSFLPNDKPEVQINLIDLDYSQTFQLNEFTDRFIKIQKRYQEFLNGKIAIKSVLQTPFDLLIATMGEFQLLQSLPAGYYKLSITSKIPMSRGLGSSASIIVCLIKSLEQFLQTALETEIFLSLATKIEAYQHGTSSGIDPTTLYLNQAIERHNTQTTPLKLPKLPKKLTSWLIDSGPAANSTGETVNQVKHNFVTNQVIWQSFTDTTQQIKASWKTQQIDKLTKALQKNQQLLEMIGVVPKPVQRLIENLQDQTEGVAKICGSGAISGRNAGVILLLSKHSPQSFCQQHQLNFWELNL